MCLHFGIALQEVLFTIPNVMSLSKERRERLKKDGDLKQQYLGRAESF